jgi:hypothetical protein
LGYVRSTVFSANFAMGGLAAPYASVANINTTNPASYAALVRTTIDVGFNVDGSSIQTKDSAYRAASGNISHLVVSFVPKPDKFAVTLGLLPYTNINYDFVQNFTDPAIGSYKYAYSGQGSLYQVFAGAAYKFKSRINELDNFSIGFNAGYIFGKLDYQKIITFPDSTLAYNTRNITVMNAHSFSYNAGIQYRRRIYHNRDVNDPRTDIFMILGAYGSGGIKMDAKISNYWDRFEINQNTGSPQAVDTSLAVFNQKSKLTMPFNIGAGAMFGNELFWMIGADFRYANWSKFSSPLNNDQLKDSWRMSLGFQITPKIDDRKFLNKIQYRLGAYYGKSEMSFQGNQLTETGGTIGLGIPFKFMRFAAASLNLGADVGTRGTSDKTAVRENYYKINVGFVLNDLAWFVKRKFD